MESRSEDRTGSMPLILQCAPIAAMVLVLHAVLMVRYPIIYGGDTILRLIAFPRILSGHQLPLLQVLIYCVLRVAYHPASIFLLMAFISALACAGVYALTCALSGSRRAGLLAAIFYATHPFLIYYSRVPYQEPLLTAGIAWGFYFLFRDSSVSSRAWAGFWLGVACLSRYEGWIAAFAAAAYEVVRSRREGRMSFGSVLVTLLAFGWAPLLWIILNHDLSPRGTYVLDLSVGWRRLYRPYFIAKSALWWTESVVAFLALAGVVYSLLRERMPGALRQYAVPGFMALYFAALVFSGHGIGPDPERILTEREAFVPVTILVVYAGIGAGVLVQSAAQKRVNRALVPATLSVLGIVAAGYGLHTALTRIAQSNSDDDLKTDFEVAQLLSRERNGGLVFAAPMPMEAIRSYVESAARWSGASGAAAAEQLLRQSETTPLDYQRVVVYSWMPRERLISGDRLPDVAAGSITRFLKQNQVRYVVVFSDFTPDTPLQKEITSWCFNQARAVREIRNGAKAAQIFLVP